ncbi:hypothetical protein BDN70DRAFT_879293 [Pholiota conissans]|uniref:Uncharacterized protein n=1 Tax=Pholiota conissans TaxID=109636 RepID=A0A9P6CT61_9AGAR|nr:hypothetical protein BDN70DRAFT_879293 [Pholiota conissans]
MYGIGVLLKVSRTDVHYSIMFSSSLELFPCHCLEEKFNATQFVILFPTVFLHFTDL